MRVRLVTAVLAVPIAVATALLLLQPRPVHAAAAGPSCGEQVVQGKDVQIKILFAKNGAVQRYVALTTAEGDIEKINDLKLGLEKEYGPEGANAPPLHIISFKPAPGGGGMSVPDKAIDSCGRTISFQ